MPWDLQNLTTTVPVAHLFSLIFQILRDQWGIPYDIGKEALTYLNFISGNLHFRYQLWFLLCSASVHSFGLYLFRAAVFFVFMPSSICLNIFTVYYLFKESWQDKYFFFSVQHFTSLPSVLGTGSLKCENLVRTEQFLPFSLNDTFQYIPSGSCKNTLEVEASMLRIICFVWNWTWSMHCNNTISFFM